MKAAPKALHCNYYFIGDWIMEIRLKGPGSIEIHTNGRDVFSMEEMDTEELLEPGAIDFWIKDIDQLINTLLDLKRELKNSE